MRILITGGGGFLGSALAASARPSVDLHVTVRSRAAPAGVPHAIDLADGPAVLELFRRIEPAVVIHTAYDPRDLERGVVGASTAVAEACAATGAALLHVSTDRVLDGERAPYDESAPPHPIEPYGEAKAEAERRVLGAVPDAAIVRTSLIVGCDPPDPASATLAGALQRGEMVRLFTDELRCPIHVDDLARQLWEVAELPRAEAAGVWNLVGPTALSRFGLGLLLARRMGLDSALIQPALNRAHPAPRPRDLRLTTARAEATLATRPRPIAEALFGE